MLTIARLRCEPDAGRWPQAVAFRPCVMRIMQLMSASHLPLAGIRVVDFSRYLPGPFCSLQLAWLGADVTCIEQPPNGDLLRSTPPLAPDGTSLASASLRRHAERLLLDLRSAADREHALQLCDDAQVVIESFRPGVADRLGIGADVVRARNVNVVYCSISAWGQTGPWAAAPGHDVNMQALSGLLDRSGTPDEVLLPSLPLADLAGGAMAATAICAALARGAGCHIDLSLAEAALALQAMAFPMAAVGSDARGTGLLNGGMACYGVYRCADDTWLSIGAFEPHFFARVCAALELGEAIVSQQFNPDATVQHDLRVKIEDALSRRRADEWHALLAGDDGGDACVCAVLSAADAAVHPQFVARQALVHLYGDSSLPAPASPWVIDGSRA